MCIQATQYGQYVYPGNPIWAVRVSRQPNMGSMCIQATQYGQYVYPGNPILMLVGSIFHTHCYTHACDVMYNHLFLQFQDIIVTFVFLPFVLLHSSLQL